jgi:hypothetical protein
MKALIQSLLEGGNIPKSLSMAPYYYDKSVQGTLCGSLPYYYDESVQDTLCDSPPSKKSLRVVLLSESPSEVLQKAWELQPNN